MSEVKVNELDAAYADVLQGPAGKKILDDLKMKFGSDRKILVPGDAHMTHAHLGELGVINYIERRIRNGRMA